MEALIWLVSLMVSIAQPSERGAAEPQHWVDHDKKMVYLSPALELKLQWTPLEIDSSKWAMLNVSMHYNAEVGRQQMEEIKAKYPGYQWAKVITQKSGDFSISIPLLKVDQVVQTQNSVEGPYFKSQYFVSKSQSEEVKLAMKSGNLLTVQGQLKVIVPESKIIEHVELSNVTCIDLFRLSNTVIDVVATTKKVFEKINRMSLVYESTREALKKSVVENCVDFRADKPIESFAELLDLKLDPKNFSQALKGETRMDSKTEKIIKAEVVVVHNLNSEGGSNAR